MLVEISSHRLGKQLRFGEGSLGFVSHREGSWRRGVLLPMYVLLELHRIHTQYEIPMLNDNLNSPRLMSAWSTPDVGGPTNLMEIGEGSW